MRCPWDRPRNPARPDLVDAGVTEPPFLDGFHIALRLHHAEKTAGNLPIDTPGRENAKTVIVTEIDRLHGRIWNAKRCARSTAI